MTGSIFVSDAFNFTGTVEAVPGLYPACKFTYRPAKIAATTAVDSVGNGDARVKAEVKLVRDNLQDFRTINDDGTEETHVLTAEQMETLHPTILRTMVAYVRGYVGPTLASVGNG